MKSAQLPCFRLTNDTHLTIASFANRRSVTGFATPVTYVLYIGKVVG